MITINFGSLTQDCIIPTLYLVSMRRFFTIALLRSAIGLLCKYILSTFSGWLQEACSSRLVFAPSFCPPSLQVFFVSLPVATNHGGAGSYFALSVKALPTSPTVGVSQVPVTSPANLVNIQIRSQTINQTTLGSEVSTLPIVSVSNRMRPRPHFTLDTTPTLQHPLRQIQTTTYTNNNK